jgi:secretion/DNA translocation related CpaE-like protein
MTRQRRPLLLTADPELLDQLLGMAAAAGVAVDVAVEPAICGPQWTDAPLVLLGADLAAAVAGASLARRIGVMLITRDAATAELAGIADTVGAEQVIVLQRDEADVLERLADATEPAAPARVIGVVGGRGGAGASTLAAGLALTAAARGPSWLIDLDPLGGGADTGLGAELSAGARWRDLGTLTGRLSPHALRCALPEVEGVAVVAAGEDTMSELTPDAVRAVVSAAGRGGGTTVLDLGRNPTSARDVAIGAADDLILVVPAELRAMIAACRVVESLGPTAPAPRVVVRAVPGALPSAEVARGLDLSLAGELHDEVTVRVAVQTGEPAGLLRGGTALAALCQAILQVPAAIGMAA